MTYLSSRDLELKLSASVKSIVEKILQAFKESIIIMQNLKHPYCLGDTSRGKVVM